MRARGIRSARIPPNGESRAVGEGQNAAENSGRAGKRQHMEREGKAEDGVSEERDDLTHGHQGKVAGEEAGSRHREASFQLNTDGWYVNEREKSRRQGREFFTQGREYRDEALSGWGSLQSRPVSFS